MTEVVASPKVVTSLPEWLTVREVAGLLRMSEWFVYTHADELGRRKVGGRNRYPLAAVLAYLNRDQGAKLAPVTPAYSRQTSPRNPARRVALLEPATGLRPLNGEGGDAA